MTYIQISKLPVDLELGYNGTAHTDKEFYDDATIFGGLLYGIHFYDERKYALSEGWENWVDLSSRQHLSQTSLSSGYTYSESDPGFINVAHRGESPAHTMHVSCLLYDV